MNPARVQPYCGVTDYENFLPFTCVVKVVTCIKHVILRPVSRSFSASFSFLLDRYFSTFRSGLHLFYRLAGSRLLVGDRHPYNLSRTKYYSSSILWHSTFYLAYRYVQWGPSLDCASLCIYQDSLRAPGVTIPFVYPDLLHN